GEEFGFAAGSPYRPHDPLTSRPVQIDDRDLGALGGEQLGDLLANIAPGASHYGYLILELHPFPSPPPRCHLHCPAGRRYQGRPPGTAANMIGETLRTWMSP